MTTLGGVHTVVLVVVYEYVPTYGVVHTIVFGGCIRVCDYSWWVPIQLCFVVLCVCVTTRGGSPYSCV